MQLNSRKCCERFDENKAICFVKFIGSGSKLCTPNNDESINYCPN